MPSRLHYAFFIDNCVEQRCGGSLPIESSSSVRQNPWNNYGPIFSTGNAAVVGTPNFGVYDVGMTHDGMYRVKVTNDDKYGSRP